MRVIWAMKSCEMWNKIEIILGWAEKNYSQLIDSQSCFAISKESFSCSVSTSYCERYHYTYHSCCIVKTRPHHFFPGTGNGIAAGCNGTYDIESAVLTIIVGTFVMRIKECFIFTAIVYVILLMSWWVRESSISVYNKEDIWFFQCTIEFYFTEWTSNAVFSWNTTFGFHEWNKFDLTLKKFNFLFLTCFKNCNNSLSENMIFVIFTVYLTEKSLRFIWKHTRNEGKAIIGPRQANLILLAYASSEGSGEPAHARSLARTSAARSYKQLVKRNLQTESQIPGPSEWLGMRS